MVDESLSEGSPEAETAPRERNWTWREREAASRLRAVLLDPALQPPGEGDVFTTAYEPDVLLITPQSSARSVEGSSPLGGLRAAAKVLGWAVEEEPLEDPLPVSTPRKDAVDVITQRSRGIEDEVVKPTPVPSRLRGSIKTVRARITIAGDRDPSRPIERPDAWRLLVEARRQGVRGVALNHVMTVDSLGINPFKGNPFKGNPFKGNPFKGNPFKGNPGGLDGYAYPGSGGRQPVVYAGARPARRTDLATADRPVVAVFDTGCGYHPWLEDGDVVIDPVIEYGGAIGIVDPDSDPECFPCSSDPLDGVIDIAAGHGTFIAGLVLQAAPDARILPVRVSNSDGIIFENDLLAALDRLAVLIEAGTRVDVLNLSFSYYHESPGPAAIENELYGLLKRIRQKGCVVVCSAGNDATDRPASPAALYGWNGSDFGVTATDEQADALADQVVVGALNPSARSVALFSNLGPWVHAFEKGVSVLSITPDFEGGLQADLRRDEHGRRRETLDLDDFRAGYAVWSGTSFAAPIVAGKIAAAVLASQGSAVGSPLSVLVSNVLKSVRSADLSENT